MPCDILTTFTIVLLEPMMVEVGIELVSGLESP